MFKRLLARFRNRRFDAELVEELRFHEEMKRQELEASGLPVPEARAGARKALGNITLMREESRAVWIAPWLESVGQDVRYAVRSLVRQPTYTLTAGIALILAIGLNTSLFTVFKALALAPWPVTDPDSIVVVRSLSREPGRVGPRLTPDEGEFLRTHARALSGLIVHTFPGNRTFLGDDTEAGISIVWATANVFDVLGVKMQLGGGFVSEDDRPGNPREAVVLSHNAWRNHFGADSSIVGRTVRIASRPFTVVGVAEAGFDGIGREVDIWMPLTALAVMKQEQSTGITARLAPGVEVRTARDELQLLHDRFAASHGRQAGRIELRQPAEPNLDRDGLALIGLMAGAVLLVLVLACSSVGNLQLARALARRREIATRLSIGASRGRVVRQLLTEGLVLATVSGVLAMGVAVLLPPLLFRFVGEELPPYVQARMAPDTRVLLFTLVVSIMACMFFALMPALRATRDTVPLAAIDRASTRPDRIPLRTAFLATQVAVCTVLLIGAALLTRAVSHAMAFDPGFPADGLHVTAVVLPSEGFSREQRVAFTQQVLEHVQQQSSGVALASPAPLEFELSMQVKLPDERESRVVATSAVSPGYFDVLQVPFVSGQMFGPRSTDQVVVNERFARVFWRDENPLGRLVHHVDRNGAVRATYTVVGVVRDAYLARLDRIEPMIFTPPGSTGRLIARADAALLERIRALALGINPAATIRSWPLRDNIWRQLEESRAGASIAWGIGVLGLVLAAVGVFGVFAYSVEERRREIGLRIALGAARAQILQTMFAVSGRAIAYGLVLGVLMSFACGPVLDNYLYGMSALDVPTYALVGSLLTLVGIVSTLIPLMRACRVNPAITLRED